MCLGVSRKPTLALVADRDVRRSPARKTRAHAAIVLKREERNGHRIVATRRIRADPDRLAHVHVIDRLAANRSRHLRLLHYRHARQRGVFADDANVDRVVAVGIGIALAEVRRKLNAPCKSARLTGCQRHVVGMEVRTLRIERNISIGGG